MKTDVGELLENGFARARPVDVRRHLRQPHAVADEQDDVFRLRRKLHRLETRLWLTLRGTSGEKKKPKQQMRAQARSNVERPKTLPQFFENHPVNLMMNDE